MSIVDGTGLPERLAKIFKKRAEDRSSIEQATFDAYDKKYKEIGGVQGLIKISKVEIAAPQKTGKARCLESGGFNNCGGPPKKNYSKCDLCGKRQKQ
jgi:hypothetical protein